MLQRSANDGLKFHDDMRMIMMRLMSEIEGFCALRARELIDLSKSIEYKLSRHTQKHPEHSSYPKQWTEPWSSSPSLTSVTGGQPWRPSMPVNYANSKPQYGSPFPPGQPQNGFPYGSMPGGYSPYPGQHPSYFPPPAG